MRAPRFLGGLFLFLALAGCSPPPEVEVLHPVRGGLQRSFTERARTRLSRTFLVPMPVDGRLSRVAVKEGDRVRAGQTLATVDPVPFETRVAEQSGRVRELEARLEVQRDAGVERAQLEEARARHASERGTLSALSAEVRSAEASHAQARADLQRAERLFREGYVPAQQVEDARLREVTAAQGVREARGRVVAQEASVDAAARQVETARRVAERRLQEEEALQGQLEAARAGLGAATHEAGRARLDAPVAGVVLKRFEAGPGTFPAGTKILEVGRFEDLEGVVEVLTQDALGLRPGMPVGLLARDGGDAFAGTVRSIDPAGFTKPSSLGVEQQRVDVVLRLVDPPPHLGVAYRMEATFVTGTSKNALLVPRFSLLQDADGTWYAFVAREGALHRRDLEVGLQGDQQVEVLKGLAEGDLVVATPDATMRDGQKVRALAGSPQTRPSP